MAPTKKSGALKNSGVSGAYLSCPGFSCRSRSMNLPGVIPELWRRGSKTARVSSDRKYEIMNLLSLSILLLVNRTAANLKMLLSRPFLKQYKELSCSFGLM